MSESTAITPTVTVFETDEAVFIHIRPTSKLLRVLSTGTTNGIYAYDGRAGLLAFSSSAQSDFDTYHQMMRTVETTAPATNTLPPDITPLGTNRLAERDEMVFYHVETLHRSLPQVARELNLTYSEVYGSYQRARIARGHKVPKSLQQKFGRSRPQARRRRGKYNLARQVPNDVREQAIGLWQASKSYDYIERQTGVTEWIMKVILFEAGLLRNHPAGSRKRKRATTPPPSVPQIAYTLDPMTGIAEVVG